MTERQQWSKKILGGAIVIMLCLTIISVFMTSCKLMGSTQDQTPADKDSALEDTYEAKIIYYEAMVQSLTTQLGEMEQQMYLLRDDYAEQLKKLEEQLTSQQKPELTPPGENSDLSGGGNPPISSDNEAAGTPDHPSNGDITLCDYTYRLENGRAILTSYLGKEKDVVIPAAVDGHLVIGLGDSVFADCDVRSVTLPKTVETLGWFTFYQCKNLEKVTLPAAIQNIGYASFDGCAQSLCLQVEEGSYAEQFANSFGIKYQKMT